MTILFWIIILLFTVTIHEYAHGLVAYWCGDKTAYNAGRLTMNPLKHIDPFWTVALPALLIMIGRPPIGMAKPVPVNYMMLKNPKRDMMFVAGAGACANIFFAAVLSVLVHLFHFALLLFPIYLNLGLAVFNLMPIPPLDGSRIVIGLLPLRLARRYAGLERYGMVIVMIIVFVPFLRSIFLDSILLPAINVLCYLLNVPGIG